MRFCVFMSVSCNMGYRTSLSAIVLLSGFIMSFFPPVNQQMCNLVGKASKFSDLYWQKIYAAEIC